jgi:hypothetical protein
MLRQGHTVALYCYRKPAGVPYGVELCDASEILPESAIIRHRSGSVSLFSNWFRYVLQRRELGTWVDSDVYLLRPLDSSQPVLIGEQEPGCLNGSVLRLPGDHPVLEQLIGLFEKDSIPPWLPPRSRLAAAIRRAWSGSANLSRMPWGVAGPEALTALGRPCGLLSVAEPPETFYPVRWQDAAIVTDPAIGLEDVTTSRTVALHLWNERIKSFKDSPAQAGSILARLQVEGSFGGDKQASGS